MTKVEMAILGCDLLAFCGQQLDFTDMLLVDPQVIVSHHEHVVHRIGSIKPKSGLNVKCLTSYQSLMILTFLQPSQPQQLIMMWEALIRLVSTKK